MSRARRQRDRATRRGQQASARQRALPRQSRFAIGHRGIILSNWTRLPGIESSMGFSWQRDRRGRCSAEEARGWCGSEPIARPPAARPTSPIGRTIRQRRARCALHADHFRTRSAPGCLPRAQGQRPQLSQNGERPLHETTCANSVHCSNVSGAEKFRPKLPYIRRAQTLTALAVVSLFTRRHYRPLPGDRGGGLAGWRSAKSFTVDGEAAVVGADAVFDA